MVRPPHTPRVWYNASLGNRITAIAALLSAMTFLVMATLGLMYVHATLTREAESSLHSALALNREIVDHSAREFMAELAVLSRNTLLSNSLVDTAGREIYVRPAIEQSRLFTEFGACLMLYDHRASLVLASSDRCADVSVSSALKGVMVDEKPHWELASGTGDIIVVHPIFFPNTNTAEGYLQARLPLSRLLNSEALVKNGPQYAWEFSVSGDKPFLSYGGVQSGGISSMSKISIPMAGGKPLELTLWGGLIRHNEKSTLSKLAVVYATLSLVLLGVVVALARHAGRVLAAPIVALRDIARAIEAGEVEKYAPPHRGYDETAELSAAFEAMLSKLSGYQGHLERKVEIRTAELRDTSERLAEAMASAQLVVWSMDLAPLSLHYVSANAMQLLRLDPEGAEIGVQISRRLTRRSKHEWLRAFKQVRDLASDEISVTLELMSGSVTGSSQWLRCRMVPAGREDGQLRVDGFMIDITTEIAMTEHARLLSDAIQESQDGIVIAELIDGKERNVFVNRAFARITGYSQEEMIGKSANVLQGDLTSVKEVARIRTAMEREEPCESLLLNYKKNGTPFWNELRLSPIRDQRGSVTHYVGIQVDVTHRVEIDTQLRQKTAFLETILRLSPDGFLAFDRVGRLRYVNPAFWRLTGLEEYGLEQEGLSGLLSKLKAREHPKHLGCVDAAFDPAANAKTIPMQSQGEARIFLNRPKSTVLAVHGWYAENEGIVFCLRDITRATALDDLKSQFLSTAAHELRTPLASVLGFTELIIERDLGEEKSRELLHIVLRQAKLLKRLVDELLDFARIEARGASDFRFSNHSVNELMIKAAREFPPPKASHELSVQPASNVILVRVDESRVVRAIGNLINNAVKYWPAGGTIVLAARHVVRDGKGFASITVSDQGIGMTSEHLSRAFERFYRANEDGAIPGTGLGLSLVKEIVEIHGGFVELESVAGRGTRATLLFPEVRLEVITEALKETPN